MTTCACHVCRSSHRIFPQETISTCRFAQRVALVKNDALVNEELDPKLVGEDGDSTHIGYLSHVYHMQHVACNICLTFSV